MGWHLSLSKCVAQMLSCSQEERFRAVLQLLGSEEFVQEIVKGCLAGMIEDPGWQEAISKIVLGFVLQIPDSDLLELSIPKVGENNGIGPRTALLLPPRHPRVNRNHHNSPAAKKTGQLTSLLCRKTEDCRSAMRNFLLHVRGTPPLTLLHLSLALEL